ncbi:Iron import ATP-binding/permease protein IrtA [Corynebacterium hansenii]|nr:ABC transporter ATP-binding protein [Corynebacterium hansenii]WJZ00788.1 Iron import ATP-binding/permease protein IrtA [Corynebacterium hansenii]
MTKMTRARTSAPDVEKPAPPPGPDDPTGSIGADAKEKNIAGGKALGALLAPIKGTLLAGRILGAASAMLSIAPYVALVRLGDVLLAAHGAGTSPAQEEVKPIVMFLLATFLGQLGLLALALALTHFADLKLTAMLRDRILERISRAPLSWFTDSTSGQIRKAVQDDTRTLHQLVAHAPVETTVAAITPLMLIGYAVTVDWRLALLALSTLPIYAGIMALTMRGMGEKTAEMDTRLGVVSSTAVEFADGITVVKAFGRTGEAHRRFLDASSTFGDFYWAWVSPMLRISAFGESAIAIPVILAINVAGGAALVGAGAVTPAEALTTTLIALVVPGSIQIIANTTWSHQLAGHAALRITDMLEGPELAERKGTAAAAEADAAVGAGAESAEAPAEPDSAAGLTVEFDDVTFFYGDVRALSGVTLRLAPGTVTALVGPSGSGKSTLATMVARFQDPDSGSVRIGGTDIREMSPEQLYARVSFVLQDPQLPRISIRDNIALARPDADDATILRAARDARIADEILALPDGLDTVIGDDANLSGGQCQRIAIARALVADTPILVLDEATASTDPDCEADIQAALNRLAAGRTVLVIGHKPESVRGADQVVHLVDGEVSAILAGDEVSEQSIAALMGSAPHRRRTDGGHDGKDSTHV